MKEKFSLKDALFNESKVRYLGELFAKADRSFKEKQFVKDVMEKLPQLELKERIVWIAEVLEHHLSSVFEGSSAVGNAFLMTVLASLKSF